MNAVTDELAKDWADVLGVDHVGVDDDFFELGGYSLSAARIVARIRERYGIEVSVYEVFIHSVLRELSEFIGLALANRNHDSVTSNDVAIQLVGGRLQRADRRLR